MPPQKREVPRTKRRLESIEPRREYFTTAILCWLRAKMAIISSVALPHVALRSPPTVNSINQLENNYIINQLFVLPYLHVIFDYLLDQ